MTERDHIAPLGSPAAGDAAEALPHEAAAGRALEASLNAWLRTDLGIEEPRRVVRANEDGILVSKLDAGFAGALYRLLDRLPELLDLEAVQAAYDREAAASPPGRSRVDAWDAAMRGLLADLARAHGIPDGRQAEVRVGIDSVRAVLDAVLWTEPAVDDAGWRPSEVERAAYRDATATLRAPAGEAPETPRRDLFTRYYGAFEGRPVENHCPGAPVARTMLAHAWGVCTGEPPESA